MPPRKTPADYHALAEKRGFRWLGPEVQNTQAKTVWECEQGHQWQAPFGRIQQGHGCPECYGNRPKAPDDYRVLAEERGFRWLGPEVQNVETNTSWECEQGHRWEASYHNIRAGTGCPDCYGNRPKTPDDYHVLAEERGFRWLGPDVPNVVTKTWWQCQQGHCWEARYNDVQQEHGCPFCACRVPKTPADYHTLAAERGLRWLGPEVQNTQAKTAWECEEGHQWQAPYGGILQGRGCPVCAGTFPKAPDDYRVLAEERGFRWLGPEVQNVETNTSWECEQGHRWEASYHNVRAGTGCPDCYGNRPKAPDDYHVLAEERGFRWLGPEVPNVVTKTWWQCRQGHCWEARYSSIQQGYGCAACAGRMPKTPADYHTLAEESGFRWLGPEVPSIKTKTWWECSNGHCWEARYNDIQQGTGCPVCACDERAGQFRLSPDDYHALAEKRGFRWLGPEVPNSATKTWWGCNEGHSWEAVYGNIRQGYGCPYCAGKAPKTPGDYHVLAEEHGFRWLGPEVPNVATKTWWQCQQGHSWETRYSAIQRGGGCPVCLDLVHGTRVSQVQRDLCEILKGELNQPFRQYNIDVALHRSGVPLAVEYDAWYWHAGREESDTRRDEEMISAGWRVLRVRSNTQLPTRKQLDAAIDRLLGGEQRVEIVLDDWGLGPTRFEVG